MDELPSSLAALVNEARSAHDPRPTDARRVALALSAALPAFRPPLQGLESLAGTPGGATTGSASVSAASGAAIKGTLVGLGSVGKGLAVLAVAAAVSTGVVMHETEEARASSARTVATEQTRVVIADSRRAAVAAPVVAETAVAAPSLEPDAEPALAYDPHPRAGTEPRAPIEAPAVREASVTAAPRARAVEPATVVPPEPHAPAAAPAGELPLIQQATQALRDLRSERVLALLAEHAARFPDGALAQEREGLRVLALCQQGRLAEALPLRARFLADAPSAPLAGRVRRACTDAR